MQTISHRKNSLKRFARVRVTFAALCVFLFSGGCFAQAQLRVVNFPGSLVTTASGKKVVRFAVPAGVNVKGATLAVSVTPYNADGRVALRRGPSVTKTVTDTEADGSISIAVTTPGSGLFQLDAMLTSADGDTLAQTTSTVAVVTKRNEVGPSDFGIVTHFGQGGTPPSVLLPLIKQAGFSWIRDEMYWQSIEAKPNTFSFPARFDTYINAATQMGISPLIVLDYGNGVAYPKLFEKSQFPDTPETRALFVRYVDAVVKRYGSKVKHWEIWNEPDFKNISYDNYLALLKDSYAAIKAQSPDSTVISCGGGGAGGGPGGDCIVAIIDKGGLNDQDGFSIHPYMPPNPPETGYKGKGGPIDAVSIPTTWPYLHDFTMKHVKANGQPLQVWVTELGWPVNPKVPGQDEATQAANLVRSYLLSRRYTAVSVLFWYDFVDDGTDINNFEFNFGLLHNDLTPKPAFVATSVLATTVGKRKWDKSLVDTPDIKVYQYGPGDPVIVGWTPGTENRTASISLPPGRYIQRDWQGVETAVTITDQDFDWQVGPLPRYLIPVKAAN
ncbi:cellulase family glycosylhydrolase [Paraburkholderia sp. DHOC27]|uniref:cellulase family glycosylhydrolase n=1 Tax=Paraburkholderia sp. DHOC27 TaxID=2303330 RepID=UPI000E3EE482|nr:cellulase family glycosylhydrolase [Paraburkholderia sp. DHOC27]RFU46019.1 beta-glucosidase [Paraburkholderia sp. DHOC27]